MKRVLFVLLAFLLLFIFVSYEWILDSNSVATQETRENDQHVPLFLSFWSGPLDEAVLLCWYYNLLNPNFKQVFYIENCPNFDEFATRYPFLLEIEFRELSWDELLKPLLPKGSLASEKIPNYAVNFKSDVFRYILLANNKGGYTDADQCIFRLPKSNSSESMPDFLVSATTTKVHSGLYYLSNAEIISQLKREFVNDLQPGGKLILPDEGEIPYTLIGPPYFSEVLTRLGILPVHQQDSFLFVTLEELFGWKPFGYDELLFCETWENQVLHGFGIHLYKARRTRDFDLIVKVLQKAIDQGGEFVFC